MKTDEVGMLKPRELNMPLAYAVYFARLSEAAYAKGYALTLHGSLQRDLDMVAIPWDERAVDAFMLADELIKVSGGFLAPHKKKAYPIEKPHGRKCWSIHLAGGGYIDLSVMPRGRMSMPRCKLCGKFASQHSAQSLACRADNSTEFHNDRFFQRRK